MFARASRFAKFPFGLILLFLLPLAARPNKQPPAKPIDINVANLKELEQWPGVGAVTAQRILDLRQKSGRFKRVEDLLAVRGISQKKLDAMRPYITVSQTPAPTGPKKNPPTKCCGPPAKNNPS